MSEYRTQSPDTSRAAESALFARYGALDPLHKLRMVVQLGRAAARLALIDIRARFPHADEHEVRMRLAARRLERSTMIAAYGWDPEAHGR